MSRPPVHARLPGRMLIVGFGSIGQGVLPLVLRHLDIRPTQITIVTADARGREQAEACGCHFLVQPLTEANHRRVLRPLLAAGDFLLNVSVDVASRDLIRLCREVGALYLDTCIEPWPGGYTDASVPPAQRSNYALREAVLALRGPGDADAPTAIVTHGANPGLVSHFVKQALLDLGAGTGPAPTTGPGWARLARDLDIRLIQVAERDSQVMTAPRRRGEFVNTWSVDGFIGEGCQPAELGWGTHERRLPPDGARHADGCDAAIYLQRPGMTQRVRSWTPLEGPYHGFLITHGESISIADHLTLREDGQVVYRPTCHYAYHPCDAAVSSIHEFLGKGGLRPVRQRVLREEIAGGVDELGVLLAGPSQGAYWYGSQLDIAEARSLAPYNSATSLQVCAAVLAGMVWAIENPRRGIVEPEQIDHRRILELCRPYLGPVVGVRTDWTPLRARARLFDEDLDLEDPWQFANLRVA